MIYTKTQIGLANILTEMTSLDIEDSSINIGSLNLVTSPSTNKYLLDINEVYDYINNTGENLNTIIEEVSRLYNIDSDKIGFSYYPSILTEEHLAKFLYNIIDDGISTYAKSNYNETSQAVDLILSACIINEDAQYLDIIDTWINEGLGDFLSNMKTNVSNAIQQNSMLNSVNNQLQALYNNKLVQDLGNQYASNVTNTALNNLANQGLMGMLHSIPANLMGNIGSTVQDVAGNRLDNKVGMALGLDQKKVQYDRDTGQPINNGNPVQVKNANIEQKMKDWGVPEFLRDQVSTTIQFGRQYGTNKIIDTATNIIQGGVGFTKEKLKSVFNSLSSALNRTTKKAQQAPPQQQSFFQMILSKLKWLKDKIWSMLTGNPMPQQQIPGQMMPQQQPMM